MTNTRAPRSVCFAIGTTTSAGPRLGRLRAPRPRTRRLPLPPRGRAKLRITIPATVATARAVLGILIVTITRRMSTDAARFWNTRTTRSASTHTHTAASVKCALLLLPPLLFLPNGGAKLRGTTPPTVATARAVLGILIVTITRRMSTDAARFWNTRTTRSASTHTHTAASVKCALLLLPPLLFLPNGGAKLRGTTPPTVATARAVLGILIVTITTLPRCTSTVATHLGNTRTTLTACM